MNHNPYLKPHSVSLTIYALIADAAGLAAFIGLRPWLTRLFGDARPGPPSLGGIAIFSGSYILFLIGVAWLRRLRPQTPGDTSLGRGWLTAQGLSLAALVALALADLSGFLATIFSVNFGDLGESYYFLITPAIFVVIGLLYQLLLVAPNEPDIAPDAPAYAWRALGGLLGVNLLCVVVALLLSSAWASMSESPVWRATLMVVALGWLLALPRYVYVTRSGARLAWLTWGLLLLSLAALAL